MIPRRALLRWVVGVLGVGLVAAALAGCVREEEPEDTGQDVGQVATPISESSPLASQPTVQPAVTLVALTPTGEPAATLVPSTPTVVPPTPFVTPAVTPPPTATPQPGVCPTPKRTNVADLANPPVHRPASEIPGRRFEGGVPYSEAFVTVHLPVAREFIISSAWSQDESNLVISIYDAQSGSTLGLRGDGCETARFVRDPAAHGAFDEISKTLEIGKTYVCPVPTREVTSPPATDTSAGSVVQGGGAAQLGPMTLYLPADREFKLGAVAVDPGGTLWAVYDVQSRSEISLRGDGCEIRRIVRYPAADAVFDEILGSLEAPSR